MTIHFKRRFRANLTENLPLSRFEPTHNPPCWGTPLWYGLDVFLPCSATPYQLRTTGRLLVKHMYVRHPDANTNPRNSEGALLYGASGYEYAIYANARLQMYRAPTQAALPDFTVTPPNRANELFLEGTNIRDATAHYGLLNLCHEEDIFVSNPAGEWFRFELWGAAGTDAYDADGLGGLGCFPAKTIHQFNITIES